MTDALNLRAVNAGGWLMWEGWIFARGFDYVGETKIMSNLTGLVGAQLAEQFRRDVRASFIAPADWQAMAALGIGLVRVPFNHVLLEDDSAPFAYKQDGWDVLDSILAGAQAAGIQIVLDMHAAPGSQSLAFVSDYNGTGFLWWTEASRRRTVALWRAIAARYAGHPAIAGYDLLNEPVTSMSSLMALYRRIISAIREVDPVTPVFTEGNDAAQNLTDMERLDDNQVLEFHYYSPLENMEATLATHEAVAQRLGLPLWCGEYGQRPLETVAAEAQALDAHGIGRAIWTWKQTPGYRTYRKINHTAASKKLMEHITSTTRPRPTSTEAEAGLADFLRVIRFENTAPDLPLP